MATIITKILIKHFDPCIRDMGRWKIGKNKKVESTIIQPGYGAGIK